MVTDFTNFTLVRLVGGRSVGAQNILVLHYDHIAGLRRGVGASGFGGGAGLVGVRVRDCYLRFAGGGERNALVGLGCSYVYDDWVALVG